MPDTSMQTLLSRLLNGTITQAEKEALSRLVQQADDEVLNAALQTAWEQGLAAERLSPAQPDALLEAILQQTPTTPVIPIRGNRWKQYTAVAACIAIIAIAGYWLFNRTPVVSPPVAETTIVSDIPAPQNNRAHITLANGSIVALDSITNLLQHNVQLTKTANGQLIYSGQTNAVAFNTLTNPRGSQVIDMTLSDGSRIWLNAGSSLIYPVAFTGAERKVTITGEAYFEVAKNASKPFIVTKGNTSIQVLGTHFNVNVYDDEPTEKITLLEGKVKVGAILLKPGQQAQRSANSGFRVNNNVDVDAVTAWRNGRFLFEEGTDIQVIMRQIARWYDVDVRYKGTIDKQLGGSISRNANLQKVLSMLQETKTVHFTIEGKLITVQP